MAKKQEIAVTQTQAVATVSEGFQEQLKLVTENLQSVENARLPRAKVTGEGFMLSDDDEPVESLEGVIIHVKKQNVYYAKPYNSSELSPPDCFSLDGVTPDKSIAKPVHATCKGCPMAEFGTNQMKSGKACRNLKPIFMLRKTEEGFAALPRLVLITPTSLKAANNYLMDLTERGLSYRKIFTKMTAEKENKSDTYAKLSFAKGEKMTAQEIANAEEARKTWLPFMDSQLADRRDTENNEGASSQQPVGEY